jgi:hypothetical protein
MLKEWLSALSKYHTHNNSYGMVFSYFYSKFFFVSYGCCKIKSSTLNFVSDDKIENNLLVLFGRETFAWQHLHTN